MVTLPDVYSAEPIPDAALPEVIRLLESADLFRYTSNSSPVALLEAEFAELLGAKYALAVSSCSAALFLSLKALDLPRDAKVLIPAFTFGAVPSAVVHADCRPVLCECGPNYRIDLADLRPNCLSSKLSSSATCAAILQIWMQSWRVAMRLASP